MLTDDQQAVKYDTHRRDSKSGLPLADTEQERMIVYAAVKLFNYHIEGLREQVRKADEVNDSQQESHKREIEEQRQKLEKDAHVVKKKKHDQDSQRLSTELGRRIRENEQNVQRLKDEMSRRDEVARRERADLQLRHDRKVQEDERKLQQQIEDSKRAAEAERAQYDAQIRDLKDQHAQDSHNRQKIYDRLERDLSNSHRREKTNLEKQVAELNTALVSRDDEVYTATLFSTKTLPQKTDTDLRNSFSEIQALVDEISRSPWLDNQTVWSASTLQDLSGQHGERRLKRAILQDIVWCLLYRYIFASPFRVFGEMGMRLEREWAQNRSNDPSSRYSREGYTWPPRSAAMERWRYMTLEKCREALSQPIPSQVDPRFPLKKGFSDTWHELAAELTYTLQEIASVDIVTLDSVKRLSKKAAQTSLDFGMHRCRIIVGMPDGGSMSLSQRHAQIKRGEVALTLRPALGRYGNNEGADLDNFTALLEIESLALS